MAKVAVPFLHSIAQRAEWVAEQARIGPVAWTLTLKGSSAAGWQCPCCGAPHSLKEADGGKAAKCKACGITMDPLALWLARHPETVWAGFLAIEAITKTELGKETHHAGA